MATWPPQLPSHVLMDGFAATMRSTAIATQMDQGPDKLRQRYTAAIEPYVARLRISTTQLTTLKTFYETTLQGGTLPFDGLAHPLTGAAVDHRFRKADAMGYAKISGDLWEVSLGLEVLP